MHRFHVPETVLALQLGPGEDRVVVLPPQPSAQIARVLRLRPGERIALFTGDGAEYPALLESVTPAGVAVRLGPPVRPATELPRPIHAAFACLKGERTDWAVQKLVELGVSTITLLRTRRTVAGVMTQDADRRRRRYERIALEAVEQCGGVRIPRIAGPLTLDELFASTLEPHRYLLHPAGPCFTGLLAGSGEEGLLLVSGPEGGFTPEEVQFARDAGALPAGLGPRTLRAETAILVAAALAADHS